MQIKTAGILSTGTEILEGLYADTNAQWLSEKLAVAGLRVTRHVATADDEQSVAVRNALDRLGEPCRSLLVLFYWEEASMDEIARRLGLANAATAKSKKYQCKEQLKRLMDRTTDGHERN